MDEESDLERLRAALARERERRLELEKRVLELTEKLTAVLELLGRNSANSNKPPSSDPPGAVTKAPKKKKGKRGRGAQKGHPGTHRLLLEPDAVHDLYPTECGSCWKPLPQTPDSNAKRYQHTELKPLAAHTTEYRRHAVVCSCCGFKTRAAFDRELIPRFAFGPRLMSVVALLTGVYNLSRRETVRLLWELLGVRISLGSVSAIERRVSDSVVPAYEEASTRVRESAIKHADGTSWLQAGKMLSLWVLASTAASVFKVLSDGKQATLRTQLFGRARGILVSDRASTLKFWSMRKRQICWAHLLRKFVAFSERDGPAGKIGNELLEYTSLLFGYWTRFQEGLLDRATLRERMAPLRPQLEALLERGAAANARDLSGSCRDILEHREALWTFVETDNVEPTNNHAERELRRFVLWRRRSFGSQSERGDLFAARLMTVAHTARKQGRDVLAFLLACCQSRMTGTPVPSLFAA